MSKKKNKTKRVGTKWTIDLWPGAFQLLIFQFLLTLESTPLQAPAYVTLRLLC